MGGVCVCVCCVCVSNPQDKISPCQCQIPAPWDLQQILWAQLQASPGLPPAQPWHRPSPQTQLGKGIPEPFCRKHRTMRWKRFGFALEDAACAELVTA